MLTAKEIVDAHLIQNKDGSYMVDKESLIISLNLFIEQYQPNHDPDHFPTEITEMFEAFKKIFTFPEEATIYNTIIDDHFKNFFTRMLILNELPEDIAEKKAFSLTQRLNLFFQEIDRQDFNDFQNLLVSNLNLSRMMYKNILKQVKNAKNESLKTKYLNMAESLLYVNNILTGILKHKYIKHDYPSSFELHSVVYFIHTNLHIYKGVITGVYSNYYEIIFYDQDKIKRKTKIFTNSILDMRNYAHIYKLMIKYYNASMQDIDSLLKEDRNSLLLAAKHWRKHGIFNNKLVQNR